MTISPIHINILQEAPQEAQDNQEAQDAGTAYDSTWATSQIPEMGPVGSEKFMLAEDKLFVVLAVVLVIWAGIAYYLFRTDRQLVALEQAMAERSPQQGIAESIED